MATQHVSRPTGLPGPARRGLQRRANAEHTHDTSTHTPHTPPTMRSRLSPRERCAVELPSTPAVGEVHHADRRILAHAHR
jgi:hypothetical protein